MSDDSTRPWVNGKSKPLPSIEYLRSIYRLDPSSPSGLSRSSRRGPHTVGSTVGAMRDGGYWRADDGPRTYAVHRLVWALGHGRDPHPLEVDHIDGNQANNALENLRACDRSGNSRNRLGSSNSTSAFVGVSAEPGRKGWRSCIETKGARTWSGRFRREHHAARAYDRAALRLHGEFARLNFPLADYVETH